MEVLTKQALDSIIEKNREENIICYSGYFVYKTCEDLHFWLAKEMSNSRDIKNPKIRKQTQTILNYIDEFFKTLRGDVNNFCFIIDTDNAYFYKLNSKSIEIIYKYLKKEIRLVRDNYFHLDYWKDLYFNDDFNNVYCLDKNDKFLHYSFTDTKYIQNDSFPADLFSEKNQKSKVDFFLMTKDNKKSKIMDKLKSLGPFVEILDGDSHHKKLKNTLDEIKYRDMIKILEDRFSEMEKNPDIFIFGNDIIKAIKNYQVKEVYCYNEFKEKIEKNIDKDSLNFKWYLFKKSKEENSILSKLNSYKGIFAKKYYV